MRLVVKRLAATGDFAAAALGEAREAFRAELGHVLAARAQGDVRFGLTPADVAEALDGEARAFVAREFPDVLEEVSKQVAKGLYFSEDDLRSGVAAASVDRDDRASAEEVAAALAAGRQATGDPQMLRRLAAIETRRRRGVLSLLVWWAANWAARAKARWRGRV